VFAAIPVTDIGSQAGSSRTNWVATDVSKRNKNHLFLLRTIPIKKMLFLFTLMI